MNAELSQKLKVYNFNFVLYFKISKQLDFSSSKIKKTKQLVSNKLVCALFFSDLIENKQEK